MNNDLQTPSQDTVKDRLVRYLEYKRISKAEFCRSMGVSTAYVNAIRKSLPEDKVLRLQQLYPDLNRDWLLYGEGAMTTEPEVCLPDDPAEYTVPLLPLQAVAGQLQDFSRGVGLCDCNMIGVPVKGADFAIQISGDSMEPEIHSGTFVAVKRINEKSFIPWGNPLVLDTENGVLVKVVNPSEQGTDYIEAQSVNPRYRNLQIPKSSIYGLYRIVAYMQKVTTM